MPNDKMISIIRSNYELLPVLNRFGLKLGFKDKTVKEICEENYINPDFFLAIINTYNNKKYFPEKELSSFSPLEIVKYLKATHIYYLEYLLPRIDDLLKELIRQNESKSQDLKMIEMFYRNYKQELVSHIREEEEMVFPYVIDLVQNKSKISSHPGIHAFEKEHSNVEIKLNDLKNLILKYVNPDYDQNTCNEFITNLFRFEKDIMDHSRIEDKILIPMVLSMEKSV